MPAHQPAFCRYTSHQLPSSKLSTAKVDGSSTTSSVDVWINLRSKIFHRSAWRWHGRTKEGQYLTEAAARNEGYRVARNGQ